MHATSPSDPDGFMELLRRAPMLEALLDGPRDRGELEAELGISRATGHRFTRWLDDWGLVERVDGEFRLTATGSAVADAAVDFKAEVATALRLGPVLEAVGDTAGGGDDGGNARGAGDVDSADDGDDADDAGGEAVPPVPLAAFADATVTTPARGDPHGPVVRYVTLVRETTTLRGFDTWAIAPTYMAEIQERIVDGMATELVDPVAVVEDVMAHYPERCVEVCASGNLAIRLHEDLPFGLAVLDDRIGIAVPDPDAGTLAAFVDTDDPVAREWAEATYEAYRAESVPLEHFTRAGLREAMADG